MPGRQSRRTVTAAAATAGDDRRTGVAPHRQTGSGGHPGAQALATYWVGQGVGLMNKIKPAREVVLEFIEDYVNAAGDSPGPSKTEGGRMPKLAKIAAGAGLIGLGLVFSGPRPRRRPRHSGGRFSRRPPPSAIYRRRDTTSGRSSRTVSRSSTWISATSPTSTPSARRVRTWSPTSPSPARRIRRDPPHLILHTGTRRCAARPGC